MSMEGKMHGQCTIGVWRQGLQPSQGTANHATMNTACPRVASVLLLLLAAPHQIYAHHRLAADDQGAKAFQGLPLKELNHRRRRSGWPPGWRISTRRHTRAITNPLREWGFRMVLDAINPKDSVQQTIDRAGAARH